MQYVWLGDSPGRDPWAQQLLVPIVPVLRRAILASTLLASCGGASVASTAAASDHAVEFILSADRALEGTAFAQVPADELAEVLVQTCKGEAPVAGQVAAAVAGLGVHTEADQAILAEVLLAGVAQLCPERATADVWAAYLAAVRDGITASGGVGVNDDDAVSAALAACASLDFGPPGDAIVSIAVVLFDVEASIDEIFGGGAVDERQVASAGVVLGAAVTFVCPEHRERVEEMVGTA